MFASNRFSGLWPLIVALRACAATRLLFWEGLDEALELLVYALADGLVARNLLPDPLQLGERFRFIERGAAQKLVVVLLIHSAS